jgi:hypothetical protein
MATMADDGGAFARAQTAVSNGDVAALQQAIREHPAVVSATGEVRRAGASAGAPA